MPHLSPMNWMLAPFLFLIISLPLLISSMWWAQTPSFPVIIKAEKAPKTLWKWN